MKKLAKYLKPFTIGLVIAIALLFTQAMADLNLPNFMSDIVNIGIQQNGIEHAAPDAISISGFRFMTTFMTAEERILFEDSYERVSADAVSADGKTYAVLYPDAGDELYVLKDIGSEVLDDMDKAFGTAVWTFINVMRDMASSNGQQQPDSDAPANVSEIDLDKLYEMQPMLDKLPDHVISAGHEKAIANDESILKQSGIMLTKSFYSEIGADLNRMQTGFILRIGLLMLLIRSEERRVGKGW